jgi:hypothetical protein
LKIQCQCGLPVLDVESDQSKARLLPDETYFSLLDSIDGVIESSGSSRPEKEAACMKVRNLLGQAMRNAWQCRACARLYVERPDRALELFSPSRDGVASGVLAANQSRVRS